ncbi:MAG: AsmA family protein [Hyphomicrobiales bacterium]|nr:AsmA family protein [Hyphomicrobiales bacterium]MDE2114516.1 AsmA family protein [Hyphomicrobiales bacterium]
MSQLNKWLALIVAIVVLGAGSVDWPLASARWHEQLASRLLAQTGIRAVAEGRVTMRLLPRPRLRFADVHTVPAAQGLDVQGVELGGDVVLSSLLFGAFALDNLTLRGGAVQFDINKWHKTHDSKADPIAKIGMAQVRLIHTDLQLMSGAQRLAVNLHDANVLIDQPNRDAPLLIKARAQWQNKPLQFQLWVANLARLRAQRLSDVAVVIDHPDLRLSFAGTALIDEALLGPRSAFTGDLVLSAAQLPPLELFADVRPLIVRWRSGIRIQTHLHATAAAVDATHLELSLADTHFSGVLAYRPKGAGSEIVGTLATQNLELHPQLWANAASFAQEAQIDAHAEKAWQNAPNLDLRLSIEHGEIANQSFSNAALSLTIEKDRLNIELAHAEGGNGEAQGRVSLDFAKDPIETQIRAHVQHIDFTRICVKPACNIPLDGALNVDLSLQSAGVSPIPKLGDLRGTVHLEWRDGAIEGIDVSRTMRRINRSAKPLVRDLNLGSTPFTKLQLNTLVNGGVAQVQSGQLANSAMSMSLGGSIDLNGEKLDLDARANQNEPQQANNSPLALHIKGPWQRPVVDIRP